MSSPDLSRRDFNRLTAAAFGGLLAGTAVGCAQKEPAKPAAGTATPAVTPPGEAVASAKVEPHACRGLNSCKSDKNECAGASTCATGKWGPGENACKNLGGCGDKPGANECKEQGGCMVPMTADHGDAWDRARKAFEERMTKAGKKFRDAPAVAETKKEEKPGS
ncbi:MAG: hypothetical protein IT428_04215 [Planctomycetaceae bacterium]|nr:hypothetical protein [Planctomycetaceae bacterium]